MKFAVTLKCLDRMTENTFFKVFHELGPFPAPEEKMRVGFRKSCVLIKSQPCTKKNSFGIDGTGL
jgi:hypothetical protein